MRVHLVLQCLCDEYLAQGEFRMVYKGRYTEGSRKCQPCVKKVFKTGAAMFKRWLQQSEEELHFRLKALSVLMTTCVMRCLRQTGAAMFIRAQPSPGGKTK